VRVLCLQGRQTGRTETGHLNITYGTWYWKHKKTKINTAHW
jgi:bisphosphoglycerate-independent phosphoglycerate mutase (AlkP superfamily)